MRVNTAMIETKGGVRSVAAKTYGGPERRRQVRLGDAFPVLVQGVDAAGCPFEVEARVANISAGGLYVYLPRQVENGAKLSSVVRYSVVTVPNVRPKSLAVRGTVRRSEPGPDGAFGVAVEFEHHQFL